MHPTTDWAQELDLAMKKMFSEESNTLPHPSSVASPMNNDEQPKSDLFKSVVAKKDIWTTQNLIAVECDNIKQLLLAKNKQYGNSAIEPVRIFSQSDPLEQIAVRIDDKLSRIRNMGSLKQILTNAKNVDEDTVIDLIGYLILARVAYGQQNVK